MVYTFNCSPLWLSLYECGCISVCSSISFFYSLNVVSGLLVFVCITFNCHIFTNLLVVIVDFNLRALNPRRCLLLSKVSESKAICSILVYLHTMLGYLNYHLQKKPLNTKSNGFQPISWILW